MNDSIGEWERKIIMTGWRSYNALRGLGFVGDNM
jgi:hypothetical protein